MKLSSLLENICPVSIEYDVDIQGLSLDSRLVKPGDLFFAYQGTHIDSKAFIKDALQRGAHAVLTEKGFDFADPRVFYTSHLNHIISKIAARFYGEPAKDMKIMGVTGTNGKTSCTYFFGEILKQLQIRCGIMGTLGNGIYGSIQAGSLTTPDPITVQKTLEEFKKANISYAAMEVSSHGLEQGRVDAVPFAVGVFTNLTRDHLDYHGSMEAYGKAKKKLFTDLATEYAVINADDDFGKQLIRELAPHKTIYAYTRESSPVMDEPVQWITVDEVQYSHSGIYANVFTPWGKGEFHTRLVGPFNLSNVLAVLTSLCLLDIPLPAILNSITQLQPVPGRMQTFGGKTKPLVVVDYAHSPDSLEKVLLALKDHADQKLYCVFGCGGDRDRGKRPLMAKIVQKYADFIVVTDDNPRTENAEEIVRDIMQGFDQSGTIVVQHDRAKAIRDAIRQAEAGDCILIAGKGAEMYQQIGDKKIPFNDAEEVKKGLSEKE